MEAFFDRSYRFASNFLAKSKIMLQVEPALETQR